MKVTKMVMYVVTDNHDDGEKLFDQLINGRFSIEGCPSMPMGMFSIASKVDEFDIGGSGIDLNKPESDEVLNLQLDVVQKFQEREGVQIPWI